MLGNHIGSSSFRDSQGGFANDPRHKTYESLLSSQGPVKVRVNEYDQSL